MTDVIVLHKIPGARRGQIVPLDERLENHVKAGNAAVLPGENDAFGDHEVDKDPAPVLQGASTGSYDTDAKYGYDEDTIEEG